MLRFILFADKCKIIRGPKPLINFKFYLDIGKHHIESKIEKNIRELGGVRIVWFSFSIIFYQNKQNRFIRIHAMVGDSSV